MTRRVRRSSRCDLGPGPCRGPALRSRAGSCEGASYGGSRQGTHPLRRRARRAVGAVEERRPCCPCGRWSQRGGPPGRRGNKSASIIQVMTKRPGVRNWPMPREMPEFARPVPRRLGVPVGLSSFPSWNRSGSRALSNLMRAALWGDPVLPRTACGRHGTMQARSLKCQVWCIS